MISCVDPSASEVSTLMEFNLAIVAAAVADAVPERDYFVQGAVRLTYRTFMDRAHQFANALVERGLGCHTERASLTNHESGQDHLALYMYNCREFLEANVGSFAARVAPFNVNYRYVDDELVYLLNDQKATAIVYHSTFAPILDRVRTLVPTLRTFLQVGDESENDLLPGAEWYEDILSSQPVDPPSVVPSPDDLYVLCTGGTTGMPKGVLWRQADIFVSALGGTSTKTKREFESLDEIVAEAVARGDRFRNMPTAPFMHGAAQWNALTALTHGNRCVIPSAVRSLDPVEVWRVVERERVTMLQIVGDAFARPLLDELDRQTYDLSALKIIMNGGANLSAGAKQGLVARLPHVTVGDGLGTSEAGSTGTSMSTSEGVAASVFDLSPNVHVLSADLTHPLPPGTDELGWMATAGRIPLGYLGDAAKTAATFPTIGGVRYVVAGDRAKLLADGRMELHGRDSATINSGGEKIFAEEVEQAIIAHPAVADVVVCGRPSERWGSEVVAIVKLRPDAQATPEDLLKLAGAHLARYKLPKAFVFRDHIQRSPAGKADYRWAKEQALAPS